MNNWPGWIKEINYGTRRNHKQICKQIHEVYYQIRRSTEDTHYNSIQASGYHQWVTLARKLLPGSWQVPKQSSTHFSCSLTKRATPSPHLPNLSFLKSLYPSTAALQTCKPYHHISMTLMRSHPCNCTQHSNSSSNRDYWGLRHPRSQMCCCTYATLCVCYKQMLHARFGRTPGF